MATRSSVLAWRIPWTEEPGGLQSTESQRVKKSASRGHGVSGSSGSAFTTLPATQFSPLVELNQGFITFKLLDASVLTAFQTLGPWKSHFCWSRPSREQRFFTLSRSLEMRFQRPVPWLGDLSRSYPQSLSLMNLSEPGVCLEPENRNSCFPLVSNKEVGNRVLRLSYKILKANAHKIIQQELLWRLQELGTRLPMQRTQAPSLVQEDPTSCHCAACTLEHTPQTREATPYAARAPQRRAPRSPRQRKPKCGRETRAAKNALAS